MVDSKPSLFTLYTPVYLEFAFSRCVCWFGWIWSWVWIILFFNKYEIASLTEIFSEAAVKLDNREKCWSFQTMVDTVLSSWNLFSAFPEKCCDTKILLQLGCRIFLIWYTDGDNKISSEYYYMLFKIMCVLWEKMYFTQLH